MISRSVRWLWVTLTTQYILGLCGHHVIMLYVYGYTMGQVY